MPNMVGPTGARARRLAAWLLGVILAGPAPAADYYYAGGRPYALEPTEGYVAMRLRPGAAPPVHRIRDALDWSAARSSPRRGITLVPLRQPSRARAAELGRALAGDPSVEQVLPVYQRGREPIVITGELLVQFAAPPSATERRRLSERYGVEIGEPLGPHVPAGFVARTSDPRLTLTAANALVEHEHVRFAHPNYLHPLSRRSPPPRWVPNDPLFGQQWHLHNSGQRGGLVDADVDAVEAWEITRGDPNVIIAITDDGVQTTHPDLQAAGKIVAGYDFADGDTDPSPGTGDDHGTAVAGVATAAGNNGLGVTGVAPDCRLMALRLPMLLGVQEEGEVFRWAADHGAAVINASWGPKDGDGIEQPLPDVTRAGIDYAATNGRGGLGCVIFWAAGNGNESADLDGYASYDKVISVAACTDRDVRASYSDFGRTVDLCAPSSDELTAGITTTDRTGANGYDPGDYLSGFGGTSSSAPLACGIGALVLSVNPGLRRVEVQQLLQDTADRIDPTGGGYDSAGHSDRYGYGRVNAHTAVVRAQTQPATPRLVFTVQPSRSEAGAPIAPAPAVEIQDPNGQRLAGRTDPITLTLLANPGGAQLSGTVTRAAVDGVAVFDDLVLDRVGSGYQLAAAAPGLVGGSSDPFEVVPAPPAALAFTVQPTDTRAGDPIDPSVEVTIRDRLGNRVDVALDVSIALQANPTGAALTGTRTRRSSAGVAVFDDLRVGTIGDGYTLRATAAGLAGATSEPFAITSEATYAFAAGLHFLGLPLAPNNPSPSAVLGPPGWELARWDTVSGSFISYVPTSARDTSFSFRPGHGFWVWFPWATTLRVAGTVTPAAAFEVELTQGWNNLANPYDTDLAWEPSRFRVRVGGADRGPLSDPANWDTIQPYGWIYRHDTAEHRLLLDAGIGAGGPVATTLPRLAGFWAYAGAPGASLRLAPPVAGRRGSERSTSGWAVELVAARAAARSRLVIGAASALGRPLRVAAPPEHVGSPIEVRSLDGGLRAAADLRPAARTLEWEVGIRCEEAGEVILSWPGLLRSLPSGVRLDLEDRPTGRKTLLNTHAAYHYVADAGERRLRLVARLGVVERAEITSFSARAGRGRGLALALTLTGPAELTVSVRGLGGRLVRQLRQSVDAGVTAVSWDGLDDAGRPAPRGSYLIEAVAVAENGAASRATRTVTVR